MILSHFRFPQVGGGGLCGAHRPFFIGTHKPDARNQLEIQPESFGLFFGLFFRCSLRAHSQSIRMYGAIGNRAFPYLRGHTVRALTASGSDGSQGRKGLGHEILPTVLKVPGLQPVF